VLVLVYACDVAHSYAHEIVLLFMLLSRCLSSSVCPLLLVEHTLISFLSPCVRLSVGSYRVLPGAGVGWRAHRLFAGALNKDTCFEGDILGKSG